MRGFKVAVDRDTPIVFEPTGADYELRKGRSIRILWVGDGDEGIIRIQSGVMEIWAPSDGYTRAWEENGAEVYIGPESE